jgi:hypothetical protein
VDQQNRRLALVTAFVGGLVTALGIAAVGLGIAVAASAQEEPAPTETPVFSPASSVHEISEHFGIRVTYFAVSPCGDTDHVLGCWSSANPDIVWVSAEIRDPDLERWVILHEIGHALHHRMGIPGSECAADMFARSMLGEPPSEADLRC